MMTTVKFLFCLVVMFVCAEAMVYKDCGSVRGKVRSAVVAGCETTPICILHSGTEASLTVQFTSGETRHFFFTFNSLSSLIKGIFSMLQLSILLQLGLKFMVLLEEVIFFIQSYCSHHTH